MTIKYMTPKQRASYLKKKKERDLRRAHRELRKAELDLQRIEQAELDNHRQLRDRLKDIFRVAK